MRVEHASSMSEGCTSKDDIYARSTRTAGLLYCSRWMGKRVRKGRGEAGRLVHRERSASGMNERLSRVWPSLAGWGVISSKQPERDLSAGSS